MASLELIVDLPAMGITHNKRDGVDLYFDNLTTKKIFLPQFLRTFNYKGAGKQSNTDQGE